MLVTLVIVIYTLRGGLKAVAWTDVFQGLLMLALMIAALGIVAGAHGGWSEAFAKVSQTQPALMERPGPRGMYTPAVWFSFLALWFFCDPMFPQLFQRFYSANSERALARSMLSPAPAAKHPPPQSPPAWPRMAGWFAACLENWAWHRPAPVSPARSWFQRPRPK